MPIPSKNFPVVMLLSEIDLQCKLISRAAERLCASAEHWIALDQGIDDGKTAPPIEILASCSVCLSAAAAIYKFLFIGDRKKGKKAVRIRKRCEALMNLLGNPKLPVVSSIAVRNSWEHLDERLDELLLSRAFKSYEQVHVAVKPPDAATFVLRCFDPSHMEIKYGPDVISLEPLIAEAKELSHLIAEAFRQLETVECHVY